MDERAGRDGGSSAGSGHWPGLSIRRGGRIVPAPPADVAVARGYPGSPEKGELVDGERLTILTARRRYAVGEEVRVIHVHEIVAPGRELFVMGPKPVYGEYVDDRPATPENPSEQEYDGAVLPGPGVDYNYDVTSYRFDTPGRHRICWRPGGRRSNIIEIEIA